MLKDFEDYTAKEVELMCKVAEADQKINTLVKELDKYETLLMQPLCEPQYLDVKEQKAKLASKLEAAFKNRKEANSTLAKFKELFAMRNMSKLNYAFLYEKLEDYLEGSEVIIDAFFTEDDRLEVQYIDVEDENSFLVTTAYFDDVDDKDEIKDFLKELDDLQLKCSK